jgi:hypothetical protein
MDLLTGIRSRWHESGESRQVTWKYVRRALILGTLSLGVTLASIAVWVAQTRHEASAKLHEQCVARVGTRDDLRGVFIGIYDTFDPELQSDRVNLLRAQLNENYPPLSLKDC